MEQLKNLPIGIQDFESLIIDNYLYVDKTAIMYKLVSTGRYYFLSRPRRFGKSLLISTLKAYFLGKRELFKGLAVEQLEQKWTVHPVLHLDLNTAKFTEKDTLRKKLDSTLQNWESQYGRQNDNDDLGVRFEGVIRRAYEQTGQRVVILVDEYDKPILQAIGNEELQNEYRATLKGFYGALKSMDGCIKFAMLTGVTKFGKVSVFSDLNNLEDISLNSEYYNICGISEEELHTVLKPYVERLAKKQCMNIDESYGELRKMYDGYHFTHSTDGMYNPFSVLNTLKNCEFGSYWFETGTPSYLAALLVRHNYNLDGMAHAEVDVDVINSVDSESTDPIPVIYQSGYLTIKGYDERFALYQLGFPNKEVEDGFIKFLIPYYLTHNSPKSAFDIRNYILDIERGNVEQFILRFKSLFADTPYELIKDLENHYQNQVWLLHKLLGMHVQAEYHTSNGRIDMVLQTPQYCYVIEFKFDGTAQDALDQISRKDYPLPFALTGQQIIRIGMNISRETRNIEEYIIG